MICRNRVLALVAAALTVVAARDTRADDVPGFDRPGIGISTGTLPAGSFDLELGLPDFDRSRDSETTTREYAHNSHFRYGLTDRLELQLTVPVLLQRISALDGRHTVGGLGDISFGAKTTLPTLGLASQVAAVLSVSAPTATADMGAGSPAWSAAVEAGWALGSKATLNFYTNATLQNGATTWLLSPSLGFSLTDRLGAYVEAGQQLAAAGSPALTLAGAGLTWMARDTVQLDLYLLQQVHGPGSDVAFGCGVSMFFH